MENKNLENCGYLLNCPDEMIAYVQQKMRNKKANIDWSNFSIGDVFYANNIYRCVMVNHPMKRIVFVTEDEYNNSFNYKYDNKSSKITKNIQLNKLVQKINWNLLNLPLQHLYVYGEASAEANQEMQVPLEKLYQYENQSDMREKIREYIGELDAKIKRLENVIKNSNDNESQLYARIDAFVEVRNDLIGRLDEVI